MKQAIRSGSIFSGIGGFDLGFERVGIEMVWQVEIDAACRSVLKRHFPDAKRYKDVKDVGRSELEPVNLICGGFPCQDVSVAGRRAGLSGERSGLWFEFHRILGELGPRWVVVENVPGLLSSNGGRDFATVLRGLVECGYGVSWRILDAQYFGVAQRRRRVFIVGSLGDGRSAEVLFEREGGAWGTPPSREAGARVAASLTRGSATGSGVNEPGRRIEDDVNLVEFYQDSQYGSQQYDTAGTLREGRPPHHQMVAFTLPASARGTGDGHGNAWNSNYVSIANTLGSHHGRNDQDSMGTYVTAFAWQQGDDSKHGKDGRGRSWVARAGEYAGALSETRHDAVAGSFGVRRLTPTECERLQGFPDGWTAGQSDSIRYRQLGNAVCVPVSEWIARRIMRLE